MLFWTWSGIRGQQVEGWEGERGSNAHCPVAIAWSMAITGVTFKEWEVLVSEPCFGKHRREPIIKALCHAGNAAEAGFLVFIMEYIIVLGTCWRSHVRVMLAVQQGK